MSKADLRIDWATHAAAKYACENWHYSKSTPAGKTVKIGAWEKGKFIGALIFSRGSNKGLHKQVGANVDEVSELARVALSFHSSPVSRIMALSISKLKRACPGLRCLVSFADTGQGHHGGIYQAAGWIYTGFGTLDPRSRPYRRNGVIAHWRTVAGELASKRMPSTVAAAQAAGWVAMPQNPKHRYLMPLDNEMRERVLPLAKPYPKRDKQAMAATSGTAAGQHRPSRSNIEASHGS